MLLSVVMEHMIAPKHVQTLLQAILVDVNIGFLLETDGITCSGMCTCTDVHSCM